MWSRPLEYAAWWLMLVILAPAVALILMSLGWLSGKWVYIFHAAFVGVGTVALIVRAIWAARRRRIGHTTESPGRDGG